MAKRASNLRRKPHIIIVGPNRRGKDAWIDLTPAAVAMMSDPEWRKELNERVERAVKSHTPKPPQIN
jgi:hypothetical protein